MMRKFLFFLMLFVFSISANTSYAAVLNTTTSTPTLTEKKGIVEKFKAKVSKIVTKNLAKDEGDFHIPGSTKSWLLYWILGAIATVVLSFFLPTIVVRLISAFTSVAFIIWILKLVKIVD